MNIKDATDFGKEIIPQSISKYKVASYQYDGYWTDIGNIYSFFEANLGLTQDIPDFNLFDNNQNHLYPCKYVAARERSAELHWKKPLLPKAVSSMHPDRK